MPTDLKITIVLPDQIRINLHKSLTTSGQV
jgi:hypothetical protein